MPQTKMNLTVLVDRVAQSIRVENPVGAARTAEVAVAAMEEWVGDRIDIYRKALAYEALAVNAQVQRMQAAVRGDFTEYSGKSYRSLESAVSDAEKGSLGVSSDRLEVQP